MIANADVRDKLTRWGLAVELMPGPQFAARELIVTTEHPALGEVRNIGLPVRFGRQPRKAARPAPMLGEHSREILAELGFEASEIAAMLVSGSVQQHPFDKGTA